MSRPCDCDNCSLDPAQPYTRTQCRLCWLYHHDLEYRALWDGPAARLCWHLGPSTQATVRCPGCTGSVGLRLFTCAVHGTCTLARAAPPTACCATCPDRDPPADGTGGTP
jgi:hypothetical protein